MFLLSQSILIVLFSAAIGALLARVFGLCNCNTEELEGELRVLREERDDLRRNIAAGAGSALTDAIGTRKAAALEAELAELRSRADELAAANAKLREGDGVDEDIAALKWRNKYLEARVLFFEGREPGSVVELPPMPDAQVTTDVSLPNEATPVETVAVSAPQTTRKPRKAAKPKEQTPAPVALVSAAAAPAKRARVKVAEVAPQPTQPLEPISNQNFTLSPLAALSPAALEEAVALAGPGKAPPRSRRRANPDDLLLIDGVGPKNKAWLNEQGIYYFYQIATMNIDQVAWLAKNLPTFGARVYRENWVAQCTNLARGESARAR